MTDSAFWYAESTDGNNYGMEINYKPGERQGAFELLGRNLHETLNTLITPDRAMTFIVLRVGTLADYRIERTQP